MQDVCESREAYAAVKGRSLGPLKTMAFHKILPCEAQTPISKVDRRVGTTSIEVCGDRKLVRLLYIS